MNSTNQKNILPGQKVWVEEERAYATVSTILSDGTLDLNFDDGDQGFYDPSEVSVS